MKNPENFKGNPVDFYVTIPALDQDLIKAAKLDGQSIQLEPHRSDIEYDIVYMAGSGGFGAKTIG